MITNPQLRQEVATVVGRHLRANPPRDSSVDDVEAAFTTAIMRIVELVIPLQGEVGVKTKKVRLE